jgi:hypothetical protein
VHVHHHRFVNKFTFLQFLLISFDSFLFIETDLERMLPLYISVFLLNWLLEDVINFVELFRGKQTRALAKVQYPLLVFVITLAGGRDKHNVYIAH